MTGQTISHYRIIEKLGEGAMGAVYKAEDTKLRRTVALKFLLKQDSDLRERFLREARAAAALHHPNICTLFEIDEENGFLAMELVEGPSLKEKIAERPLKLEEALDLASQIAGGLQAAHGKGVVHRDIKPANILLTPQGQVKITDFGLAALADKTRLTKTGVSMGTPAYMSPEQARGEAADRRTDIWSLGVVIYEMVSGRLPFGGEVEAAVANAILTKDPEPLTALRTGIPLELDRVAGKALAKNPAERYQHVEDLLVDLGAVRKRASVTPRAVSGKARAWGWATAGALAASVIWAVLWWRTPEPEAGVPAGAVIQRIARYTGTERFPAISPDGRQFAYASSMDGQTDIWVRQVAGGEPVQLTRDASAESDLVYSADGEFLYYSAGGAIWKIGTLGGNPRKVLDRATKPSLSADGRRMAFMRGPEIHIADSDGTGGRKVCDAKGFQANFSLSPDGLRIAFVEGGLFTMVSLHVVGSDGTGLRKLIDLGFAGSASPAWLPDSRTILYTRSSEQHALAGAYDIWAVGVDGGPSSRLTLNHIGRFGSMRVSRDGRRLVASILEHQYEVWRAPLGPDPEASGRSAKRLLDNSGSPMWIHRSGNTLLFSSELSGGRNLWAMPLERTHPAQQLTSLEGNSVTHASLSPEGSRVAYTSMQTGNAEIWTMNTDGSNPVQLTRRSSSDYWPVWTSDGKWISFGSEGPDDPSLWKIPSGGGEPVRLTKNGGVRGDWSPVENKIVYSAGAHVSGGQFALGPRIEVADSDGNVLRTIPWSSAGATLPVWSPDGRRFTAIRNENPDNSSVWVFDAASGAGKLAVKFPGLFRLIFRACWTPDGQGVIVNRQQEVSHIVMIESFWERARR